MITLLKLAAAIGVLVALGHGVLRLVIRTTKLHWYERWAIAWVLGTGTAALIWFLCMPLYRVIAPAWLLTMICAGVGAMGIWSRPRVPREEPAGEPGSVGAIDIMLGGALAIEAAVLTLAAVHTPLGWDGLFNFELKARLAFEHVPAGQLPLEYFSDASRSWSHPRYPLLVPFAEFWIYSWLGRVDQSAVKILFPIFYVSLIGIICGAVKRVTNRRMAIAAAIVLGLLPPLTLLPGAVSGYADVPLAAAVVGAACFAFLALRTGNTEALVLAAALSSVAVWTKSEGLVLAAAIGVSAIAATWLSRIQNPAAGIRSRSLSVLLWLPLLTVVPWLITMQLYGMPDQGDFLPMSVGVFVGNLDRAPTIAVQVIRELLRPGHWALIWPCFFLSLALMLMEGRSNVADGFLASSVVVALVAYTLVFVFSAWTDVREHIGWSLVRLLVPLAPVALLFTIRQLGSGRDVEAAA